ncbi:PDDEXK nuclease domain-containing protein [Algoriphagus sp. oki45]|uniref:PDDEXK nuclease domain-containing protein n=1 Tax=Algoriphagus sp. oki45 TaxID=3067294 RepID=UPI0027F628D4|nr:PDDEXK nuclease domain-containing protein [Algoriphagus sp. oki45]
MGYPDNHSKYSNLKSEISQLLKAGREQAGRAVNSILVQTYWHIGRHIVEFEQGGEAKSEYGANLLDRLSLDLTMEFGKGFSRSNLFQIRTFYSKFQKVQTLSGQLSWSHYCELIKAENELEISFYTKQCEKENWSVRELKRQMKSMLLMKSMLFHRLALSKAKEDILHLSQKGAELQQAKDLIKDPYVFEFLGLKNQTNYTEGELETELIKNLQSFLLELGKGFAFIGQQYRISLANRHFYVDLVFYHRILKCFVLIDLKSGEIDHQDIGQMNLYLNYFRKEENVEGDNPPIGIVLGAFKDHILVEYATENISNQLFVSKYQLYLPEKEELAHELERLLTKD